MTRYSLMRKIADFAISSPNHPAYVDDKGLTFSYSDFYKQTSTYQQELEQLRIPTGARVALITNDSYLFMSLGVVLINSICLVVIESRQTIAEMISQLRVFDVECIVTNLSLFDEYCHENQLGLIKFSNFQLNNNFEIKQHPVWKIRDKQFSYLNKTSGTTQQPKVFGINYDGLLNRMEKKQQEFNISSTSTFARFGTHINIETLINYLNYFSLGGTVYFVHSLAVSKFVDLLKMFPITDVVLPALAAVSIEEYLRKNDLRLLGAPTQVQIIGASIKPDIIDALCKRWDAHIYSSYGTKEVSGVADRSQVDLTYKPTSIGKIKTQGVKIIDDEICVRSVSNFVGYENFDNSTVFYDDYFRTGDMGYIDDEGFLYITGRFKEMINLGGEKVSPYEVEFAINEDPRIFESVAFPIINARGYEDLALAIVLKDASMSIDLKEVRTLLMRTLSPQKLPTYLFQLERIPRNNGEKIARRFFYQHLCDHGLV
jgi:acyl-CoA synthetase (AMP-forming)/AMP-acid ligase II